MGRVWLLFLCVCCGWLGDGGERGEMSVFLFACFLFLFSERGIVSDGGGGGEWMRGRGVGGNTRVGLKWCSLVTHFVCN